MKRAFAIGVVLVVLVGMTGLGTAGTEVPGHEGEDGTVTGHYTAVYAYDANGDWYLDYGDDRPGNPAGTVDSIDDLEQSTLTQCDYVINYRGDFGDDPFLDDGWIQNHIRCQGYDVRHGDQPRSTQWTAVHETNPRYTGDGVAVWGDWEYHGYVISGEGSVINPHHHQG